MLNPIGHQTSSKGTPPSCSPAVFIAANKVIAESKVNAENSALTECPSLSLVKDFIDSETAQQIYRQLHSEIQWPSNTYKVFDRHFELPRLQSWHADTGIVYSYSNNLLTTRPWTSLLSDLCLWVEVYTQQAFNAVLVNYYRSGQDFVGWHSDDEKELGESPVIASLTLGASREFQFREKANHDNQGSITLTSGSLLMMAPEFQHDWQHAVLKCQQSQGRINLTFRQVQPMQNTHSS